MNLAFCVKQSKWKFQKSHSNCVAFFNFWLTGRRIPRNSKECSEDWIPLWTLVRRDLNQRRPAQSVWTFGKNCEEGRERVTLGACFLGAIIN